MIGRATLALCGAAAAGTDQQANAAEKADRKTLIQMAVVYQGNQASYL